MTLTELRALADKATPGPRLRLWASTQVIAPFCGDIFDPAVAGPIAAQVNLDFAAACSPEAIKALIAVAEAAEARRERDDSRLRLWLAVGECGHQDGEACPELEAIAVDDPSEEGRISGALRDALDALREALA